MAVNLGAVEVERAWANAIRTKALRDLRSVLVHMAGARARCFYCSDSRGYAIDHFWPKSIFHQHAFFWPNLMLACFTCNTRKGTQFPRDAAGNPLLVDLSNVLRPRSAL